MENFLVLFDIQAYRDRVEPVLKDFFKGGMEGPILQLLQETNQRVSASEPCGVA